MASIFTKIVNGEIPCHKISETENCLAFLDIQPLVEGHTLVIPKREVNYIFDVDNELYTELWNFAREVARKVESKIDCARIGVAVVGLEVPHAHIHLIPINSVADMDFSKPKLDLSQDQLRLIADKINS
jgi:histidine triad (HIT) family protein